MTESDRRLRVAWLWIIGGIFALIVIQAVLA